MNLRQTASIVAVTAALAWLVGMASGVRSQASGRLSDFAAFYASGRLVGTGELYDARQLQRIEKESTGRSSPAHGFVRPPFHALIFWPLGQLPYNTAEVVWVVFSGTGLWGFVWLWPIADLKQRWILVCLSLPAWPYSVLTPLTIAVFAVLIARSTSAVSRTAQSAACPKQGPSTVSP